MRIVCHTDILPIERSKSVSYEVHDYDYDYDCVSCIEAAH